MEGGSKREGVRKRGSKIWREGVRERELVRYRGRE